MPEITKTSIIGYFGYWIFRLQKLLMKRFSTLIAILLLFSSVGLCYAQDLSEDISEKNLSPLRKVYVGYRIIPDPYNPKEMAFEIEMRPVVVYPNERFRNKNEENSTGAPCAM